MSNRYAIASGNWSNPATWDGGTLPVAGDDVRANNFTVTIDQDITVGSIRTDASSPAVGGGLFDVATSGRTINANIVAGTSTTNGCLRYTAGGNLFINGNIFGGSVANSRGVFCNNAASIIHIIGDVRGGALGSAHGINSAGVVNITGDVVGGAGSDAYGWTGSGNLNITGNVSGGVGNTSVGVFSLLGPINTINIIGNVSGGAASASHGIWMNAGGTANITGVVTAVTGNGAYIHTSSTAVMNIFGIVKASNSAAVAGTNNISTLSTFYADMAEGSDINAAVGVANSVANNNILVKHVVFKITSTPISANVRFVTSAPSITVLTASGTLVLTDPATTDQANPQDVRYGVAYNSGGLLGTLKVPAPESVAFGVEVDAGFGVALLTPENLLEAIKTSSEPLAERLRNVATVQTVGDQFNSL